MKPILVLITVLTITLLNTADGVCHGVGGYVEQIEAHCLTAMYDDGEPMSYAAVEIKAPDADIAFQTGRTDRNGCFMVRAETPGTWQAVVSDGMGHRLALDFSVAAGQKNAHAVEKTPAPVISNRMSRPFTIVVGLSMIIGLCGFFYGWKARRTL